MLNRTPWTAKSVGSGMAHTEASQTAPHPWIHLASPVAAQTPVMQDPSTSASCAGLAHAPNVVTTAVGGSALRHEPTTITVVLAPHAGRQEASIIRSISGLTGSSPEGPGSMIFPASMKREVELKMTVRDVSESMINLTPTPRRRVLVPLRAFVVQVASACLVGTATRQSPKAAPALALVADAFQAPASAVSRSAQQLPRALRLLPLQLVRLSRAHQRLAAGAAARAEFAARADAPVGRAGAARLLLAARALGQAQRPPVRVQLAAQIHVCCCTAGAA